MSMLFKFILFFSFQQERALYYVDDVKGNVQIGEGITLVQTEPVPSAQGRSLSDIELAPNVEARESQVDSLLTDRVARFLGTHTLQFKVPKDSIEDMQRSLEEGKQIEVEEKERKKKSKTRSNITKFLIPIQT